MLPKFYKNKLFIFILFLLIIYFYNINKKKTPTIIEKFNNLNNNDIDIKGINNDNKGIYDNFYAEIYDQLFRSDLKNEYECLQIQKNYIKNWKDSKVKILDVGCGTGLHLKILNRYGYHVEGIDESPWMIKKAKKNCPKGIYKRGDFNNPKSYTPRRFTHILCLFFTIYYTNNLNKLFYNFNLWLQPKGLLFIHVVMKDKFDPVLERASSLIPLFDPQRHTDVRATRTQLEFKEFSYESDWDLTKKNKSKFKELFTFKKEPYVRENIHTFNLIDPKRIIKKANNNGFELIKAIDLFLVGHNNTYLMVFRKKYGK